MPPVTVADGLRTSLGDKTFQIIKKGVDRIFLVSEQEIKQCVQIIVHNLKVVVEPSSATVLAAILKEKEFFKGKNVCAIFTGGNIDRESLINLI